MARQNFAALRAVFIVGSAAVPALCLAVEPQPIQAGPFDITPTVDVDYSHTDNMFLSNNNEVSSNKLLISPKLEALLQSGNNTLRLNGQVDEADFSATDEDDYTDWRVGASSHLEMSSSASLDLNAGFFRTREMRGTGFSQGGLLPTAPDRYEETTFGGMFTLGNNESIGRLELAVNSYDKAYFNNRLTTRFRDRDDLNASITFYYNLSPRTSLLAEYRNKDVNYGTDPVSVAGAVDTLDSENTYYYVGVSWEATGKTTGSFRIGDGEKKFDDPDRQTANITSWEANVQWEPLTYSIVNFNVSRSFDEATGVGNNLDRKNYLLNWTHDWSANLSTEVNLSYSDDYYTGSTRSDTMEAYSLKLNYSVRRWLDVFGTVSTDSRASNFNNFDYDQNVVAIGFAASL